MRTQARACRLLGSNLYAELMERAASELETGDVLIQLLGDHVGDAGESALALRLFGGAHRLAWEGLAPALASHYPSTGGDNDVDGAWHALVALAQEQGDYLIKALDGAPQTNEVGRSAGLMAGFQRIAARTGLPLRILEVGASAGLNLRWDHFRYQTGEHPWGDPTSPVVFPPEWFAGQARSTPWGTVTVAERRGCDISPIDPNDEDGRLTLRSYLWPDQTERLARLNGALDVASRVPAEVERADAGTWLAEQLDRSATGTATVVFHSIFIQYLAPDERSRLINVIKNAGQAAGPEAPLAWLRLEPAGAQAEVSVTAWPGDGSPFTIASAGFHGPPIAFARHETSP
ncbi:MAG: DUF2332 domain-containing protein [Acidimicrobiales bacterium]